MQVKKIIKNGFVFLAILIVVYFAVMFLLVKIKIGQTALIYRVSDGINWKGGNTYQKFIDFDINHKYDVIVVGSSHAYRGYDPRIFIKNGSDLYNLGTSSQSVFNSYFISKNYITSSNCKLAILEMYDGALSSDAIEPTSDLVQNISSNKAAFEMVMAIKDPRAFNMFTVRLMTKGDAPMYYDSAYVFNGYSEKKDSVKVVDENWRKSKFEINEMQVSYLRKTISYFKEKNITILLVSHPAPIELNNGNHEKVAAQIETICKDFNVEYIDYSYTHNLKLKVDFYDAHHLNQSGVLKFNEMLILDLRKRKYIHK